MPVPEPIVLWGATGQARVLADFLPELGFVIEALMDRDPGVPSLLPGVPVFRVEGAFRDWLRARPTPPAALVAIGGDRGGDRLGNQQWLRDVGCRLVTAIHPRAIVAATAQVGAGSQVLAGAVVGPGAALGEGVIVNTRAGVDHECRIGDGVHIAPGATLCGLVVVGALTFLGAGAVVLPRVRIGAGTVVGAGAVVTRDLPDNVVAYGQPARIIRTRPLPLA
ncbi:MAG: acetyltransferase [Verrucomicrobiae bacterium]|nr:acetyltransferase [Verrucomicrobiae bacterium]